MQIVDKVQTCLTDLFQNGAAINGAGFQPRDAEVYECVVALWTDSAAQRAAEAAADVSRGAVRDLSITSSHLQGTQFVIANITRVSSSEFLTRVTWPFAASKTLLFIRSRVDGEVVREGENSLDGKVLMVFPFVVADGVQATEITTSGYAMDPFSLVFRGAGFRDAFQYTCILIAARSQNSSSVALTWERNVSVIAVAKNTTVIICPILRWPFAEQEVVPALLEAGSVVFGSLNPQQTVPIIEHWTHVTPRGISILAHAPIHEQSPQTSRSSTYNMNNSFLSTGATACE